MLEIRPGCECCDRDLAPDSTDALICTLHGVCPNCGRELVRRPVPQARFHLARLTGDELATTVARIAAALFDAAGNHQLVDRDQVERLLDEALELTPALERALERLTASPLVADKVPGLGSLVSLGTRAAAGMVGAADKQLDGLLADTAGKGGTLAVRRLNRIIVDTLRDPTTREAALQVWDLVAAVGHAVVDGFFEAFGGYTPVELLVELELDHADLVADLVRFAPAVVETLVESGEMERLLRAELAPFYASDEVATLLAAGG